MKKLVSILLTLAVAVSLLVVPAMVSAADYTVGGSTISVGSVHLCDLGSENATCFDAEPETLVLLDGITFDAQTSEVVIAGNVSALDLGAGWVDTAYVEIGLRPDATKDARNAGVYLIALNTGEETWIHLQDYSGNGNEDPDGTDYAEVIKISGLNTGFRYEMTLTPSGSIGGTATLEVWIGVSSQGTSTLNYGYASTWEEDVSGSLDENFSDAHLFYSIIADRRGAEGETYSATVGDITISGDDISGSTVGLTANTPEITAISVTPAGLDFGTITPGTPKTGASITAENIGTVTVSVSANLDPTSAVFQYLYLNAVNHPSSGSWSAGDLGMANMLPTDSRSCTTELDVPATYNAQGTETATLIFEASPA